MVLHGEVACNSKQLARALELPAFLAEPPSIRSMQGLGPAGGPPAAVAVVCGAVVRSHMHVRQMEAIMYKTLRRGVPLDISQGNISEHSFTLVYNDLKYPVQVRKRLTLLGPAYSRSG